MSVRVGDHGDQAFFRKNREGGGGDDVKVRFLSEKGGMKVEEEKHTYHIVQRMKTLQQ